MSNIKHGGISRFLFEIVYGKFKSGNFLKRQAGFTLVEIVLTLSIMGILSLFGASAYQSYNSDKIMDLAASEVSGVLELAKSRARSQVKPSVASCASNRELYGYRVTFCPGNCTSQQTYTLSVVCGDTGQYSEQIGETYTLPSNVTFTSSNPQSVTFRVLSNEIEGASNIGISGFEQVRTINVSSTGVLHIASSIGPTPTTGPSTIPTSTPTSPPPTSTPTSAPPTEAPTSIPPTPTPTQPSQAIALDPGPSTGSCSSCTSLTVAYTVPGSSRILIVGLTHSSSTNPTSVTYAGSNMALAGSDGRTSAYVNLYYLPNPPLGTHNVVVTSSTQNQGLTAASFSGVNMSNPVGTPVAGDALSTSVTSPSVTTTATDIVVSAVGLMDTTVMTPGSLETAIVQNNLVRSNMLSMKSGVDGTLTMSASWSGSKNSGIVAIPLRRAL